MNPELLTQQVLKLVFSADYKPSKPTVILKSLKLPEEDFPRLRRAIKQLIRTGQIAFGANHLVFKPHAIPSKGALKHPNPDPSPASDKRARREKNELTGVFRTASSGGFGFVRVAPALDEARMDDVFIPPPATHGAMEGDTVRIRVVRSGKDGRTEGTVEEIVSRSRRDLSNARR